MRIEFGQGRSISLKPEEFIKVTLKSGELSYVRPDGRLTTVSLPKDWTDGDFTTKVEPPHLQKENILPEQDLLKIKQVSEEYMKNCFISWPKVRVQLDENLSKLNQRLASFQTEIENQKKVIDEVRGHR